ncbi:MULTISPECIES: DUF1657 domain-containing protein [Oceanobacillus]|uniref:DUF1657 domain-containing protein n=1 Tax=Oceanobacillus neutriphilus TaxID=531815 RepID=A0ABQ2NZN1_9BACI|nr:MULTISPECIES: DUF1657 domain-containing protein [Oceanobacillus]MCT1904775.1 DUF1657 domain-containing protein [Oceanobacillus sojae]GGP14586.1 hypothetical protein GCM10011346_39130 [Oceanobacillus neutriphilus]
MTVGTQVQQTISGLKSAQASLEQFALQTDNKQAQQLYKNAAQQTQGILDQLEPRVQQVMQEEPQYKQ